MDTIDLEYLTICQECGCVFEYTIAIADFRKKPKITICPFCKHEYELPNKKSKDYWDKHTKKLEDIE